MSVQLANEEVLAPTRAPRGFRGALAIGVAVGLLVLGAGYAGAVRTRADRHPAAPAANPLYLPWPARGSLRNDTAVIEHAHHIWDYFGAPEREGPTRPHTDVRVLYAERLADGDLVVLQGMLRSGVPQLAVIFIPPWQDHHWVPEGLDVITVPNPLTTRQISFPILTNMAGDREQLVVIGEPGTTTIAYRTPRDPDTVRPVYVEDGVGVASINNDGIEEITVVNAGGTIYQGRTTGLLVHNWLVGFTPPA